MEWCEDTWHASYEEAPTDGTPWVDEGTPIRVYRGGGWLDPAEGCRSANRNRNDPEIRFVYLGFRPVFVPLEN